MVRLSPGHPRHGYSRSTNFAAVATAKSRCGTADRLDPTGMRRSYPGLRRTAPSSRVAIVHEPLQRSANTSVVRQRCSGITCRSCRRPDSSEADSRWSPPRVRPVWFAAGRGQWRGFLPIGRCAALWVVANLYLQAKIWRLPRTASALQAPQFGRAGGQCAFALDDGRRRVAQRNYRPLLARFSNPLHPKRPFGYDTFSSAWTRRKGQFRRQTIRLLRKHQATVRCVANALLERVYLASEEIDALMPVPPKQ